MGKGVLSSPGDVAVDLWGNAYVSDTGNDRILKLYADDDDGDRIPNAVEVLMGTNPLDSDTDGDGYSDIREVNAGTSPANALSIPYYAPLDYAGDLVDNPVSYETGWWHVLMSDVANHWSDAYKWGIKGDIPVCGDFDGDGVSDFSVFRPSVSRWYIYGTRGSNLIKKWGIAGDVPISGDFDGDRVADFAIYRPSSGWWVVLPSGGGGVIKTKWGIAGDVPVPGDYDGDGLTDYAVFRPDTGWWYIQGSTVGIIRKKWGIGGDEPVPGYYDADGITDLAVYRRGYWIVQQSSTMTRLVKKWGVAGDAPVAGDYDGNGRDNFAIFRKSNAVWIISLDSGGRLDVPAPSKNARPVHQQYRINRYFGIIP